MSSQPLISVLIPVYNVAPYVERSIASLQTQTISDLQIVVVNDGSQDNTLEIIQRMAVADPRIEVLSTPKNGGIVGAMNLGLSVCRAPYIARIDGDDIATPDRLEKQLAYLEKHPDVALVGCQTSPIDVHDNPIELVGSHRLPVTQEAIAKSLHLASPCLHIWLARRDLYQQLRGYREFRLSEDYDFLLRAVTSGYKIANLDEQLMKIRIRPGNSADTAGLVQRKTQHYIVKLYKERLKTGTDTFSEENLSKFIHANKIEKAMHACAVRFTKRAFQAHSRAAKMLFLLLSAGSSVWQARYFLDRARQRLILRSLAKAES